jgi:aconitate hydratase
MSRKQQNSFGTRSGLVTSSGPVQYFHLAQLEQDGVAAVSRLPLTIRILLEAALRAENGHEVTRDDVLKLATYDPASPARVEVPFKPARVLVQDFTGVPAIVDLAALRSAMARLGGDPQQINPQIPVDLVIDHSVQVDEHGTATALGRNAALELERNRERYQLLRWGQQSFHNLTVVPPATGICHQVNLEYLATVVQRRRQDGEELVFPDSLVGLDSHTTMINGLGILGWGVGGIEAEAAMLGQPLFMLLPQVIGLRLSGELPPGATATDLALAVTELLRRHGVVGRFVELFGSGLSSISLADRATIANMAPEYGATCSFFPVDDESLRYLRATGRPPELVDLVERYCKEQGLFRTDTTPDPEFYGVIGLDLGTVTSSLAGPRRPQDRIALDQVKPRWQELSRAAVSAGGYGLSEQQLAATVEVEGLGEQEQAARIGHGAVVLAAITSCTNTSNPSVMLGAGILARKAVAAGLRTGAHVKTSLAPGSKVVTEYLQATGLLSSLEQLGFHVVGYGCTTCIGNSGPLPEPVRRAILDGDLVVAGVLSGNRNFEGRIHQLIRANFLASPPLVVAYALAGTIDIDLGSEPLGHGSDGRPVYLKDIWPTSEEIAACLEQAADAETFRRVYARLLDENESWNQLEVSGGTLYQWQEQSTYIQEPPFFLDLAPEPAVIAPIPNARVLVMLGDSVTTDHISPAGAIAPDSPAGRFLIANGVTPADFNSYGSRRGNDRIMTRGTFANIRLKNRLAGGREGGWTTHFPSGDLISIFEAAQRYQEAGTPTVVLAGVDYGMGSSRDWAAKGTFLLGIRAVIARSFERIHRSNLVGMGVLPLQLEEGDSADSLGLDGQETFAIDIGPDLAPGQEVAVTITSASGETRTITVTCRIDTPVELEYYRNGGILHTVLRRRIAETQS